MATCTPLPAAALRASAVQGLTLLLLFRRVPAGRSPEEPPGEREQSNVEGYRDFKGHRKGQLKRHRECRREPRTEI